jgi:sterol desaturase/sphingolipid hydroxylase (fatty acid hydroxylase superfamily)
VCTILELVRPARALDYRRRDAVLLDAVAFLFTQLLVFRLAQFICFGVVRVLPQMFMPMHVPLAVRVALYYILGDFGGYWMHRLNHTRHFWRFHLFHHSITQLYWFSGVRDTVPQQALSNVPYIFLSPLVLVTAPSYVYDGFMIAGVLTNHWMHMNVAWRSNWLEWIFVTPRSHHLHHSSDSIHYDKNFGVVFSVWDRLFGTWADPDLTSPPTAMGAPKKHVLRMMVGF